MRRSGDASSRKALTVPRRRSGWTQPSAEIRPRDPVLLGLCQQIDLDQAVAVARAAQSEREPAEVEPFGSRQP